MALRATPRRLTLALAVSLALHGLLVIQEREAASRRDARPAPPLRVTLRTVEARPPSHVAPQTATRPAPTQPGGHHTAQRRVPPAVPASTGSSAQAGPVEPPAPALVAPVEPDPPRPSANALIESARGIAREIGRERAPPGPGAAPNGSVVERAFARHLARSTGSAEKVLADGSRWVRFRNGTCMFIPQVPRPGQVNGLGEPITTVTNCPDSITF